MPAFVGLTGGIAAGKSTALEALADLGAATLSTDSVVHELYASEEIVDPVKERFGADVAPDGRVDRARLAERAFATEADRTWLEELLWPRVGERVTRWREDVGGGDPGPRAAVVEVPLLFESGMEALFDATIAVIAPEDVRAERAGGRGHQAVDERSARQLTQSEKAGRATFVVVNDGDVSALREKLSDVLGMLER